MNPRALIVGLYLLSLRGGLGQQTVFPVVAPISADQKVAGNSTAPVLSRDGVLLIFLSQAKNLTTNSGYGATINIFLRNLTNQSTTLVSVNTNGTMGGTGHSGPALFSGDGRFVVFESLARNLVAGDLNDASDIFVRDLVHGTTALASVNFQGTGSANKKSFNPSISQDGRYVLFESLATDLVTNAVVGQDVYLRDMQNRITTLVSTNGIRRGFDNALASDSGISADGLYVTYLSIVTNLTFNASRTNEVCVRDLQTGETVMAGARAANYLNMGFGIYDNPSLSSNGQFLVYKAMSSAFPPNTNFVIWEDWRAGTAVVLTSHAPRAATYLRHSEWGGPTITGSGRFVAYESDFGTYLWDAIAGTNIVAMDFNPVPTLAISSAPQVSEDGRYFSFLYGGGIPGLPSYSRIQLAVHDTLQHSTTLVSARPDGTNGCDADVHSPSMSASGGRFAFAALDGGLLSTNDSRSAGIFVRDLNSPLVTRVSQADPGFLSAIPDGIRSLGYGGVSSNGNVVVLSSRANGTTGVDTNGYGNVFLRELTSSNAVLVSANTNGTAADGNSIYPAISGDANWVAFVSNARDLAPDHTNQIYDVFLRNTHSNYTQLISSNIDSSLVPRRPGINHDGGVIAYEMGGLLYRWSSTAGTVILTNNLRDFSPALSSDGQRIGYLDSASNVRLWDSARQSNILVQSFVSGAISVCNGFSGNGRYLLSGVGAALYLYDADLMTNLVLVTNVWPIGGATMDFAGRYVAYSSSNSSSILVWDTLSQQSLFASPNYLGGISAKGTFTQPMLSQDGRYIVFTSTAPDLIPGNTNLALNVYLRDLQSGTTTLLSASQNGTVGDHISLRPVFGGRGTILLSSAASDLVAGDFNGTPDLFYLRIPGANFVDSDGDGMDDDWERKYFGDLSHDGTQDSDGDGVTDRQEFLAGTNPNDRNSVFKATPLAPPGGGALSINWQAQPGLGYRLQYKNNLTDSNWVDLATPMTVSGSSGSTVDNSAAGVLQRFYRLFVVP